MVHTRSADPVFGNSVLAFGLPKLCRRFCGFDLGALEVYENSMFF